MSTTVFIKLSNEELDKFIYEQLSKNDKAK
jgi:hypothetical protein